MWQYGIFVLFCLIIKVMSSEQYPPWQEYSIIAPKQGWIIDNTDPEYRGCKNMWTGCGSSGNGYQGCFNFVDQNCKPKLITTVPMTTTTTIITPTATEIAVTTKGGSTSTTNAIDTFFKLTSTVQPSTASTFKLKTLESTKLISQTPSTTLSNEVKQTKPSQTSKVLSEEPPSSEMVTTLKFTDDEPVSTTYKASSSSLATSALTSPKPVTILATSTLVNTGELLSSTSASSSKLLIDATTSMDVNDEKMESTSISLISKTQKNAFTTSSTTQTTQNSPDDAVTSLKSSLTTLKLNNIVTSEIPSEATQRTTMAFTDSFSDATMKSSVKPTTLPSSDVTLFDTSNIQSSQKLYSITSENNFVSETTSKLVTDDNSKSSHGPTRTSDNLASKNNDFTSIVLTFPSSKKYGVSNSETASSSFSTSNAIVAKETASELLNENKAITTPTKLGSDFSMASSQSNIFDSSTSQKASETSHELKSSQSPISSPSINTPSNDVSQLMEDEFSSKATTSGANKNDMNIESTFDTPTTDSNVFSTDFTPSFTSTKLYESQTSSRWTPSSNVPASESFTTDSPSQTFDGKASPTTMSATTQINLDNFGSTDNSSPKFYTLEHPATVDLGSTVSQSIIQTLPEKASASSSSLSSRSITLVTDYSTLVAEENSKKATTVLLNADNVKTTVNNLPTTTITSYADRKSSSPIDALLSTKDDDQTSQLNVGTTKKENFVTATKNLPKTIITSFNPADTSSNVKITKSVHPSSYEQSSLPFEAIITSIEPIAKISTSISDASSPGVKNDEVQAATNLESQGSTYSTQSLLTTKSSKSIEPVTHSFASDTATSATSSRISKNTGSEFAPIEKFTSESPDMESSKIKIIFGTTLNLPTETSTLKFSKSSPKSTDLEINTFSQQQPSASFATDNQVYDITTTASHKIITAPVTGHSSSVTSYGHQIVDQISTKSSKAATRIESQSATTQAEVTNPNTPSLLSGIKPSQSHDFSMMSTSSMSESQSASSHVQSEVSEIITQKSINDLFSLASTKLGTSEIFVDSDEASIQILTTIPNTAAPLKASTISPAMSSTLNTATSNTNPFIAKTQETEVHNTEKATTIFSKSASLSSEKPTLAQNSMATKKFEITGKPFITLLDTTLTETETKRTSVDVKRDTPTTIISSLAPTSLSPSSMSSEKLATVSNSKTMGIKTEVYKEDEQVVTSTMVPSSTAMTSTKETTKTTTDSTGMNSKIYSPISSANMNTKFVTATKTQTTSEEDKITTQTTVKELIFEPTSFSKSFTTILDSNHETLKTSGTPSSQLNSVSDKQSSQRETHSTSDNDVKTSPQKAATYPSLEANPLSTSPFTPSDSSSTSTSSIIVSSASTSTSFTSSKLATPEADKLCEKPCPLGFSEGSQACYKWMDALTSDLFNYTDFENECFKLGNDSVIVSLIDFEFADNVKLFNKLRANSKNNNNIILTNTVWTKKFMISRKLQAIDLNNFSAENKSIVEYYDSDKSLTFSSICRIGKYCKPHNCNLNEYMASPS